MQVRVHTVRIEEEAQPFQTCRHALCSDYPGTVVPFTSHEGHQRGHEANKWKFVAASLAASLPSCPRQGQRGRVSSVPRVATQTSFEAAAAIVFA